MDGRNVRREGEAEEREEEKRARERDSILLIQIEGRKLDIIAMSAYMCIRYCYR